MFKLKVYQQSKKLLRKVNRINQFQLKEHRRHPLSNLMQERVTLKLKEGQYLRTLSSFISLLLTGLRNTLKDHWRRQQSIFSLNILIPVHQSVYSMFSRNWKLYIRPRMRFWLTGTMKKMMKICWRQEKIMSPSSGCLSRWLRSSSKFLLGNNK